KRAGLTTFLFARYGCQSLVSHPRWRCLPPTSLSRSIVNSAGAYIRVGGDSRSYLHCHPPSHNLPNIMSDFVLGRVANQPVVPGEVDLRRCPLSNGSYLHWLAADLSFGYRAGAVIPVLSQAAGQQGAFIPVIPVLGPTDEKQSVVQTSSSPSDCSNASAPKESAA